MIKDELWTLIVDYLGGTYIKQFEVQELAELVSALAQCLDQPFLNFRDEDVEWTPVEGTNSVFCFSGLTTKDELYIVHAVKTSR